MKKVLVIATSLFVLSANAAIACSCFPTRPQESFQNSEAVFSGRVVDVTEQSPAERRPGRRNEDQNFLTGVKVTFEVSEVWKGNNQRRLVVSTSDSSASCGYSFQEGQEYLVYASEEDAQLKTGLCSGTKRLSDARADLAMLGEGQTPINNRANAIQLQQNRQLWRNQNISSYRYTLQVSCFCTPDVTQPVVVEVRNNRVTSIKAANTGKPVNEEYFRQYNSVPKLFNLI
ncbi:MAG: hypothetical protein F6K28_23390 [Microcoleus sp. SIO2G3]|nr:hypothetical protein [Microcoleus sp. SIO2G3]